MAYVSFISDGEEVEYGYFTNGSEHVVTIQIGYDDVMDCTYSLMCSLSPFGGAVDGEFESVFCVVEYDHGEECEYLIWDGLNTRGKIPDSYDRACCLGAIAAAVEILVSKAEPRFVTMTTYSAGLPPRALAKFDEVCATFSGHGFTIGKPNPYHGQHCWFMERVS